MAIGSFGSGYEASGLTKDAVADFIRSEAARLGIDPEVALRVAKTEGFNSYQSTVQLPGGGRERSYGPFQLYMGGGLGNEFEKATGINPERDRSDASVKAGITYALQHAATKGWGAFHGARNNGIGNRDGIGGSPAAPVQGGGTQNMNPMLLMQNQSIQEQPQQGGLAGMFNDPGKLAALQLLISGLNPWSKGDELAPFARLAQLRQSQAYDRQKDERDYKLREQQFQLNQQNTQADNKRADEQFRMQQEQAGLTPISRDIIQETGFKPGSKEYQAEYKRRKEEEQRAKLMNEDMKGFEYAKKYEGFTGTPQEWIRSKRAGAGEYALTPTWGKDKDGNPVILQLGKGGEAIASKLPEGVSVNKGFEKIDLGTHWGIMDTVTRQITQTLPKNIEEKAVAEATGEAKGKAVVALPAAERTSARAIKMLDELEKHPGFNAAVGLVDARLPAYSSKMADFRERVEQIDAMVFGDAVEVMRGLGALTDREGPKITAARARLKTAKSEEDFRTALKDVREVFNDGIESMRRKAGVTAPSTGGKTSSGVPWKVLNNGSD